MNSDCGMYPAVEAEAAAVAGISTKADRHTAARRLSDRLSGHLWTILPALRANLKAPAGPRSRGFQTILQDPAVGPVRLTGLLSEVTGSRTLVLIVHGLGGDATSPYCAKAARAAWQHGFSSLCLSLRGADCSGEDILHGGITQDVRAALAAAEIARYQRVLLLGYSVGGHIALRAAIDEVDSRLYAAAAICPPLDLAAATRAFDHPALSPYRRHIFRSLNKAYSATAARGRVRVPPAAVESARSCRERDSLTVVVRFGYRSASHYYERESVAPRLNRLRIPALLVASRHDPLVPPESLMPALDGASRALTVKWAERGGHVYFPPSLDLQQTGPLGLEHQVIGWLGKQ